MILKKLFTCRCTIILSCLFISLFSACSKENNASETPADGSTVLEFEIGNLDDIADGGNSPADPPPTGLPEFDIQNSSKISRNSSNGELNLDAERSASTQIDTDTLLFDKELAEEDYDVRLSLTGDKNTRITAKNVFTGGANRSGSAKVAAAMPTGNRYRVLIYDANDSYVGTIDATSGTGFTPGFPVFRNTTYKWYAYSYNSTTQVPLPQNTANPTIATTAGVTALLYDSGTLQTVAGSNKINITFEHKLASIALVLDARGMFATINAISASNANAANLRTGTLNLRTGVYNSTSPNTASTSLSNWTNLSSTTGDSVKVAYFYTAGTTEIQNFAVALSNFVVNLDDGSTRTFSNRNYAFQQSFTPQLGRRYTARITLIESAVTVAGIRWGRENLFYRSTDRGYRFRNRSANIYGTTTNIAASGEYFNFGSTTNATNATTATRDICRLVFPYGTWRLPTNDEFIALAAVSNSTGTPRRVFGQTSDSRYVGWTFDGNDEYGTNWVTYLGLGRRAQNANTITNYSATANTSGYFWSSTFTQGSTNARYLRVDINGTTANSFSTSAVTANLTENMTFGMNIRCVRN